MSTQPTTAPAQPGFWENLFQTGGNAASQAWMMDRLGNQQGDIKDMFSDLMEGSAGRTEFQPWTTTSNLGNVSGGPDGMDFTLSDSQQHMQNALQFGGGSMLKNAMQDPTQARNDYYDQMRAAQSPEEARQKQMMDARLQAQGRSGIRSNAYGGTPEQLAMMKAQEENKNTAMLNADQMAQQGLQNQYTMGSGMFQQSYLPMQQLMAQAGQGMTNAGMGQKGQLSGADMYNQLALGGATADMNYDNMMNENIMQMLQAGNGMLSQGGNWLDNGGSSQIGDWANKGWSWLEDNIF